MDGDERVKQQFEERICPPICSAWCIAVLAGSRNVFAEKPLQIHIARADHGLESRARNYLSPRGLCGQNANIRNRRIPAHLGLNPFDTNERQQRTPEEARRGDGRNDISHSSVRFCEMIRTR